jgi:hypothetical protein
MSGDQARPVPAAPNRACPAPNGDSSWTVPWTEINVSHGAALNPSLIIAGLRLDHPGQRAPNLKASRELDLVTASPASRHLDRGDELTDSPVQSRRQRLPTAQPAASRSTCAAASRKSRGSSSIAASRLAASAIAPGRTTEDMSAILTSNGSSNKTAKLCTPIGRSLALVQRVRRCRQHRVDGVPGSELTTTAAPAGQRLRRVGREQARHRARRVDRWRELSLSTNYSADAS